MMNLTSKIVDNLQVSIKNIHVRYEDPSSFYKPLSLGLTMQQLVIETTNEKWEKEFFDRTYAENKQKPLQKIIDLKSIGVYINPKDSRANQISLIESEHEQLQLFEQLFPEGSELSGRYEHSYISLPISSVTKLKQISSHATQKSDKEPMFQVSVEIPEINIKVLKSQYEALFKVVEQLNDFALFTDNHLNKRAVKLSAFYQEEFAFKKQTFLDCLLKMVTKRVTEGTFEGQTIPLGEQARLQKLIVFGAAD